MNADTKDAALILFRSIAGEHPAAHNTYQGDPRLEGLFHKVLQGNMLQYCLGWRRLHVLPRHGALSVSLSAPDLRLWSAAQAHRSNQADSRLAQGRL